MNYVIVKLATALICFTSNSSYSCHPALIGPDTPLGVYTLTHYLTEPPDSYGGDILVFKEDNDDVWAIHRVIDVPGQHRLQRLKNGNALTRSITHGCINVDPKIFQKLVECCSNSELYIIAR